jgi:hypothetical protein
MTIPMADRLIGERYVAQLLAGPPAADALTAVERLLAVQGQDPRGARLAIRARTSGVASADVDRALSQDSALLLAGRTRGTLHLVGSEDYAWLPTLTTPQLLTGNARRLAQEGVTPDAADRAVEAITRSLAGNGPQTRIQLRDRIQSAGVRTEGQALVHVLALASHRGLIVRGPMVGKQHAFALTRDWLGDPKPIDRDRVLAELARRFLAGHGPATDRDLAQWAGVPLRDARAGLHRIANELVERDGGMVGIASRKASALLPPARLLGPFEPVLLGWTSRVPILGEHVSKVTVEGVFRGFALVRGKGVATWSIREGRVVIAKFRPISSRDSTALKADADRVLEFLNLRPSRAVILPD